VARDLYTPGSDLEIKTNYLEVEQIVHEGDVISLGDETITVIETKGHTDCSLTYAVEPMNLLICCESTGLIESLTYVNTPILKSFDDAMESLAKVRSYGAKYVCLPHFGLLPTDFNEKYWDMFKAGCDEVVDFARKWRNDGLTIEEMVQEYYNRYWNPLFIKEQPKKAYLINTEATVKAALKAAYR
ncbi:MAG: hypothetical protein KBS66_00035, partial [Eubacterium sp.]|nr:hypothetical protein [Candidatus Colimonas fimequi]